MEQDIKTIREERPLMVTIRCITYNHEPYIRQCLEGFVMQKTNFRFEAIVHDDVSTDGTADIIREYAEKYPDIIKPIYETENQYSKRDGSLRRIMDAHTHGKYVAICEGDDYWIDPLKLQKQVDFLENHSDYGMCYTKVRYYYQESAIWGKEWGGNYTSFKELYKRNTIPTLSCLYRKDLYDKYVLQVAPMTKGWKMGDYPMWLWFSHESKIAFLPIVTGVYRVLKSSASHSSTLETHLAFNISGMQIKEFFNDLFHLGIPDRKIKTMYWLVHLRSYAIFACWDKFFILWLQGIKEDPSRLFRLSSYKYFPFIFLSHIRKNRM